MRPLWQMHACRISRYATAVIHCSVDKIDGPIFLLGYYSYLTIVVEVSLLEALDTIALIPCYAGPQ